MYMKYSGFTVCDCEGLQKFATQACVHLQTLQEAPSGRAQRLCGRTAAYFSWLCLFLYLFLLCDVLGFCILLLAFHRLFYLPSCYESPPPLLHALTTLPARTPPPPPTHPRTPPYTHGLVINTTVTNCSSHFDSLVISVWWPLWHETLRHGYLDPPVHWSCDWTLLRNLVLTSFVTWVDKLLNCNKWR